MRGRPPVPKSYTCRQCGKTEPTIGTNQIFCSPGCRNIYSREYENWYQKEYARKNPARGMLKTAKSRAKAQGLTFNLTLDDIILPEVCPVLGIQMFCNSGTGAGGKNNSYSLDRINPNLGYISGNVQVISHKANSMKSNATRDELLAFARWVLAQEVAL